MSLFGKNSILKSIYHCKCPRCHEGNMFLKGQFFNPVKFSVMNKNCSHCGQSFEPEPGFYFGAMFISYGINTALFISVWVAIYLFKEDYSLTLLLSLLGVAAIVFLPFIYRVSRSIWIAIFVRFEERFTKSES